MTPLPPYGTDRVEADRNHGHVTVTIDFDDKIAAPEMLKDAVALAIADVAFIEESGEIINTPIATRYIFAGFHDPDRYDGMIVTANRKEEKEIKSPVN